MTEDKQAIIDKVRKVLSLAHNNPNQHEGETAMLHAQKLMAEHNLQMSEVTFETINKTVVDEEVIGTTQMPWWYKKLSSIIAHNFRCHNYISRGKRSTIQFLGLKEDVELAKEVYLYAIQVIYYNSDKHVIERKKETTEHPARIKNAYILGFLIGLTEKFEEQVKQHQEWGLVLVVDPEVQKKYNSMHLVNSKKLKARQSVDIENRVAGYNAGKKFEMIHGKITGE